MTITQGDTLHHNIDNKTYLILSITPQYIELLHIKDGKLTIQNNPQTLSKFTLINQ